MERWRPATIAAMDAAADVRTQRLTGLDAARGLAVLGMAVVNYDVVLTFGVDEPGTLRALLDLPQGRAAALFVMLAGIGFTLLDDRRVLLRRAVFLGMLGYGWYELWPGDILHHYTAFLLLGAATLGTGPRVLAALAASAGSGFIAAFALLDYGADWNWLELDYTTFWTPVGQVRNQLFNGLHPVLPWMAFVWIGMAWGRAGLREPIVWRRGGLLGGIVAVAAFGLAAWLGSAADTRGFLARITEWYRAPESFWGTSPIPPGPLYVLSASGIAAVVISTCLEIVHRGADAWLRPLRACGRMALTLYVAHILLLFFVLVPLLEAVPALAALPELVQTGVATLCFWVLAIGWATIWDARRRRGPLEAWMRTWAG